MRFFAERHWTSDSFLEFVWRNSIRDWTPFYVDNLETLDASQAFGAVFNPIENETFCVVVYIRVSLLARRGDVNVLDTNFHVIHSWLKGNNAKQHFDTQPAERTKNIKIWRLTVQCDIEPKKTFQN